VKKLIIISPVAIILLIVVAECAVRGLYAYVTWRTEKFPLLYESVYWDVPPWIQYRSILYYDPDIGLIMKPRVTRTYVNLFGPIGDLTSVDDLFSALLPTIPSWVTSRQPWHLKTNAMGFRDDDIDRQKRPGTFRIAVLGDSWTVGINVECQHTYPSRLADFLRGEFPHGRFEVLNFGAIGATSSIGTRLLPRVLAYQPDVVVLAYAANDESQVAQETKPVPAFAPPPVLLSGWVTSRLELPKMLTWYRTHRSGAVAAMIQQDVRRSHGGSSNDLNRSCGNPHADETSYRIAIDGLVGMARERGADVILVYNNVPEFFSHCTLRALTRVAKDRGAPLIDASSLLFERGAAIERSLERERNLVPMPDSVEGPPGKVTVVVRVDMAVEGPRRRPFVMGNAPQLGGFEPNEVPLFDDGTHGDQVANDGVWEREFIFDSPGTLIYMFTDGDRAGE